MGFEEAKRDTGMLTSAAGVPLESDNSAKRIGKEVGSLVLSDFELLEKNAHFNRERIPERVVHAVGAGAHGTFKVTQDITKWTSASLFSKVGKETPVFARFSTVARKAGGGDNYRDLRGFSIKFYTDEGNWDLVGNNTPIFFVRDPMRFQDFIHSQKEHPREHWRKPGMWYDFWSKAPESMHQVLWLMGDRGLPQGWRHCNGYGSHTFSFVSKNGERHWVKFHFKSHQGNKFFSDEEAARIEGIAPKWSTQDLYCAIEDGNYPKWTLYVQIMTDDEAKNFKWNPFDLTKVWPHKEFPLHEVGMLELNRNPENYFAEVEQAAFSPHNKVPGIDFSPDPMLQARIMAYADAHRYRLGVNYEENIPINKPVVETNTPYIDGLARHDNHGSRVDYQPTDDKYPEANPRKDQQAPVRVSGATDRYVMERQDHFDQPKLFLDMLDQEARNRLISNIVNTLGLTPQEIQDRQLELFKKVDQSFANSIQQGLQNFTPPDTPVAQPGQA